MLIAFKPRSTLLIVTANANLKLELTQELKSLRYQIEFAAKGDLAIELMSHLQPEFVILDWQLPAPGALQLCRDIRSEANGDTILIIALCTSNRAKDRIEALEAGVNDYLTNPFTWQDLVASMAALQHQRVVIPFARELNAGEINMALDRWVVYLSGKELELTHKEFRLLEELLAAKGRVLTRESLLEVIWGHTNVEKLHTRTVDIHMSRLRRKLGSSGRKIITVRNVGYRIDIAPEWISQLESPRKIS